MREPMTEPWDPALRLKTREDVATYLAVALEEAGPEDFAAILDQILRSEAMEKLSHVTGLSSQELQEAFSPKMLPHFQKVLDSLGMRIKVVSS